MKLTESKLRSIIREEAQRLNEQAVMKYTTTAPLKRAAKAYKDADVEVKKDEDGRDTTWVVKGPRAEVERWIDIATKDAASHITDNMYDSVEGGSAAAKAWSKAKGVFR